MCVGVFGGLMGAKSLRELMMLKNANGPYDTKGKIYLSQNH